MSDDVIDEADNFFIEKCVELKFGKTVNPLKEDLQKMDFFRDEIQHKLDTNTTIEVNKNIISFIWSEI